jgi:hypothetical protein
VAEIVLLFASTNTCTLMDWALVLVAVEVEVTVITAPFMSRRCSNVCKSVPNIGGSVTSETIPSLNKPANAATTKGLLEVYQL